MVCSLTSRNPVCLLIIFLRNVVFSSKIVLYFCPTRMQNLVSSEKTLSSSCVFQELMLIALSLRSIVNTLNVLDLTLLNILIFFSSFSWVYTKRRRTS